MRKEVGAKCGAMEKEAVRNGGLARLALTRVEAAKAIGQSPATIDRLRKRGLLHPSLGTRRPVYPVEELQRYLRETTTLPWQEDRA